MQSYQRKKEEFSHRGVKVLVTYFVTASGRVDRFDVSAVLDDLKGEEKLGASILGWETEKVALEAARTIGQNQIDKHLSMQ